MMLALSGKANDSSIIGSLQLAPAWGERTRECVAQDATEKQKIAPGIPGAIFVRNSIEQERA